MDGWLCLVIRRSVCLVLCLDLPEPQLYCHPKPFFSLSFLPHPATRLGPQVSRGERAVWVDQWCRGARQLSQWDHLAEYARATDSVTLSLDCMWRLTDWQGLHQTLQNVQVMSQIEETPQVGAAGVPLPV